MNFPTQKCRASIVNTLPNYILFQLSPPIIKSYTKFMTWYQFGRKYCSPIEPLTLYYIQPDVLSVYLTKEGKSRFQYKDDVSEVQPGDWDKMVKDITNSMIYSAFKKKFHMEIEWEDTEYYSKTVKEIRRGKTRWGCNTIPEFESRLRSLERLYSSVSKNGYRSQRQLRNVNQDMTAIRDIHMYWPPELHEITINISREGTPILHDGRHRLYIAKLTEVERIPVRIKTRHQQWQNIREKVCEEKSEKKYEHFDLQFN